MKTHARLDFLYAQHNENCRSVVAKRYQGYHSFQLVSRGAVELFYDDQQYLMECGSECTSECGSEQCWFWTSSPGPFTRFHAAPGHDYWDHRYASFAGPEVDHWLQAGLWPQQPQAGPRGKEHERDFDDLIHQIQRGDEWGRRRALNRLEGILLELAECRSVDDTALWLRQVDDFLDQCREFTPNYSALARQLGMSLPHLRKKFKAARGVSLHEALLQLRIRDARRLLAETDKPIKQIAAELGYRDVYFFTNQFKVRTQFSPAVFRQSQHK